MPAEPTSIPLWTGLVGLAGVVVGALLTQVREDRARTINEKRQAYQDGLKAYNELKTSILDLGIADLKFKVWHEMAENQKKFLDGLQEKMDALFTVIFDPEREFTPSIMEALKRAEAKIEREQRDYDEALEVVHQSQIKQGELTVLWKTSIHNVAYCIDRLILNECFDAAECLRTMLSLALNSKNGQPDKDEEGRLRQQYLDAAAKDLSEQQSWTTRAIKFHRKNIKEADEMLERDLGPARRS